MQCAAARMLRSANSLVQQLLHQPSVKSAHRRETDEVWTKLLQQRHHDRQQVEAMLDDVTDARLKWTQKKDNEAVDVGVLTEVQWLLSAVRSGTMSEERLLDELDAHPLPKQWHHMVLSALHSLQFTQHIGARRQRHRQAGQTQMQQLLDEKDDRAPDASDKNGNSHSVQWNNATQSTTAVVATRPSLSRAQRRAEARTKKGIGVPRRCRNGFMAPRAAEQRRARKKDGEMPSGLLY